MVHIMTAVIMPAIFPGEGRYNIEISSYDMIKKHHWPLPHQVEFSGQVRDTITLKLPPARTIGKRFLADGILSEKYYSCLAIAISKKIAVFHTDSRRMFNSAHFF